MRLLVVLALAAISLPVLADSRAGERKAQLCLLCHKPGNVMAAAPLLEAQPAKYLVAAINAYKTGVRPDPVMQTNVAKLSTRDIGDIADYFASRPAIAAVYPIDASKVAAGATRLGQLNCGTCHQPTFYGSDVVPRLAGQITGYLMQQLEAFAGGRRMHPPAEMPASTGDDMENISTYFTSLK